MKIKYLIIALLGLSLAKGFAITSAITVLPNTMTNVATVYNGSAKVTQIIVTSTTATNSLVTFIDSPTNQLSYVIPAYTNRIAYATNYITSWTNYYGLAQSDTNIALITTNNAVPATTNAWPIRLNVAALASTSSTYSGVNYYFNEGIWVTNNGSGTANITVTYQQ